MDNPVDFATAACRRGGDAAATSPREPPRRRPRAFARSNVSNRTNTRTHIHREKPLNSPVVWLILESGKCETGSRVVGSYATYE
ncbi:hypothetical protein EVAR_18648_1 [Eumeta japonica]|uniref:Uncharacterized protein n=1 Tax=Eumeta variegata TaxID=151549 RepID=A0A4C1U7E1_EUMVA|nr:hypothetical protein EVAR_18648_1 [Eumeta japonica]